MKNHEGDIRSFSILSQAWYGESCLKHADYVDEVTIGFYSDEGGTSGEFSVRWIELGQGSRRVQAPHLEVFNDAWPALYYRFNDMLAMMAETKGENTTPMEFAKKLEYLGIVDRTKRHQDGDYHA